MTPEGARAWIAGLEILGMRLGLERIRALLAALGDPQRCAPALHVVGSNGKTSTTRLAAAAMAAGGGTVGAYLSPHVTDWTERIQVGGAPIDDERFARAAAAAEERAEAQAAAHRQEMEALRERLEGQLGGRQAEIDELTARNAQLQAQSAAELEQVRSQLQGQIDAMAGRKVVRLADSAARALGQTGRVLPATRLAKLWAEHALDREHD